ncbi:EAL domain-containing protein [Hyphomicrobium sp. 99]|uniref:EAL domain-containing protein n=1 Tax=Hyphomicrobium sp. 99 TaxID=1163419 RepID=UPI001FD8FFE5|nr:EAL domain-containing protein [Hyphomicrobium sp. 99]
MAFQPIVNVRTNVVYAHEALVRGAHGEAAGSVLAKVSDENRYAFDQRCRVKAIELAAQLKLSDTGANLSINFLPNAVYEPTACIRLTLAAAEKSGFPLNRIIFEFTEVERLDTAHTLKILAAYRSMGFKTAIDDFGAGFSSLGMLAEFQPDLVKLDMELIRNIDTNAAKRSIVRNILHMLRDLNIIPICEGIEAIGEYTVLRDLGVELMQGYLLARPALTALASPVIPDASKSQPALVGH